MTNKKKVSANVEVQDDGGFRIELSTGMMHKQHKVSESVDGCVKKVSEFLRSELTGSGVS
jgi:hypothetical protein